MNIKAYEWDDEYRGESHIVWAATPGKAKALLAAEHDREFTEMRVSRVPWADKYGDSKRIPAEEFLSRGWRIVNIVKGNGDFWATLELETEKNND